MEGQPIQLLFPLGNLFSSPHQEEPSGSKNPPTQPQSSRLLSKHNVRDVDVMKLYMCIAAMVIAHKRGLDVAAVYKNWKRKDSLKRCKHVAEEVLINLFYGNQH